MGVDVRAAAIVGLLLFVVGVAHAITTIEINACGEYNLPTGDINVVFTTDLNCVDANLVQTESYTLPSLYIYGAGHTVVGWNIIGVDGYPYFYRIEFSNGCFKNWAKSNGHTKNPIIMGVYYTRAENACLEGFTFGDSMYSTMVVNSEIKEFNVHVYSDGGLIDTNGVHSLINFDTLSNGNAYLRVGELRDSVVYFCTTTAWYPVSIAGRFVDTNLIQCDYIGDYNLLFLLEGNVYLISSNVSFPAGIDCRGDSNVFIFYTQDSNVDDLRASPSCAPFLREYTEVVVEGPEKVFMTNVVTLSLSAADANTSTARVSVDKGYLSRETVELPATVYLVAPPTARVVKVTVYTE